MPELRSFQLTSRLLAEHRAGAVLALDSFPGASSYSLPPKKPDRLWSLVGDPRAHGALRHRADEGPSLPVDDAPPPSSDASPPSAESMDTSGVALLRVFGPIAARGEYELCGYLAGYDDVEESWREALADARVEALVVVFDSPGGDVARLEETCRRLSIAIADSGKPCLAYVDELAASAAYRLACVCQSIHAPAAGRLGSIGTIAVHVEESKALEDDGMKVTIVRSPAGKAAGHPAEPLSPLALSRIEQLVEESTATFVRAVAAARGIEADAIMDKGLNGSMLSGAAAVAAGLADSVDTIEAVVTLAATRAKAAASTPAPAATPPASPAPAGALAPAKGNYVKSSSALLALLPGLAADATPATIEAVVLPRLRLANVVLTLTGSTDPEAAEGGVRAMAKDSAEAADLRAKLAEQDRAAEAEKLEAAAKAEAAERVQLVGAMVKATPPRLTPAEAWARDKDGKIVGVAPEWDKPTADGKGMSITALRAMVAKLQGLSTLSASQVDTTKALEVSAGAAVLVGLSASDHAECARTGRDPAMFAAVKATLFARPADEG